MAETLAIKTAAMNRRGKCRRQGQPAAVSAADVVFRREEELLAAVVVVLRRFTRHRGDHRVRAPVATVGPNPSLAVWECLEGSVSPGVARALGRGIKGA